VVRLERNGLSVGFKVMVTRRYGRFEDGSLQRVA